MKFITLMFLLASTGAFASPVCQFEETFELAEAHKEIRKVKRNFSALEKQMIHAAVELQTWRGELTQEEAMREFLDIREDETTPGSLAGSIVYYNLKGKLVALVSHYPGDNEYGAFYEVKDRSFKMIARISDSFIECK